ncbi:N-acetylmuramoyl-L-alanine amidase [Radiobacillus sp. PE A8.2]|uniref:N-acetylmuramoyl-L-alanine amidase family protein n=1 Tax=Radiobacillus sp. PE A8.2 TaxID=3380349 RepID=UPI00388D05E9
MSKVLVAFLDDGHGEETAGKRTPYMKALGRSIKENEFNKPVVALLQTELERCGVNVVLVAPEDRDTPLKTRTDRANKTKAAYDKKYGKNQVDFIYVSIHFNAYDGSFTGANPSGISLHVYLGNKKYRSGELAGSIAKYVKQGTKQEYRGVKENNFHVLRETKNIPAVLSENGFMDNPAEANLMLNKKFQKEVAVEHAKGICDYFGIAYQGGTNEDNAGDIHRIFVDEKQVIALRNDDSVLQQVEKYLANAKEIKIQKV